MADDPLSPTSLAALWHDDPGDRELVRRLRRTLRHAAAANEQLRREVKDLTVITTQQQGTITAQKQVIDRLVDGAAGRHTPQEAHT